MRILPVGLAAITALTLSAAGAARGEERTYPELTGFSAIDVSAGINVEIRQSESFAISAEAPGRPVLDHLEIRSDGDTLIITRDGNFLAFILEGGLVGALLGGGDDIHVTVALPELTGVFASSGAEASVAAFTTVKFEAGASGGADLTISDISAGHVELSASSGADLEISGTCATLDASATSGSDLNAERLNCAAGNLSASSGADLSARITEGVQAESSSGADVTVYGNPQQTDLSNSSGGGVRLRN